MSNVFHLCTGADPGYATRPARGSKDWPVWNWPYGKYGETDHSKDSWAARQAKKAQTRSVGAAKSKQKLSCIFRAVAETYSLAAEHHLAPGAARAARGVRLP